ncbi:MAG: putative transposase family, partial [Caballeronia mineralivorans]|nr:putative transposase family [Caballeronia mineralivorans]
MSRSARGTPDKPGRMVKQKGGLNREILSAGFSMAH